MIALVTGGSGFVGRNLVRRLLDDGHEVRCLVRSGGRPVDGRAKSYVVTFDEASLARCPALDGADVVFHLAAATRAIREDDFTRANVLATQDLLAALAVRRVRGRFVFVSSQAAAGPAHGLNVPVDEDTPPNPVDAYGRSKLAAERVVAGFANALETTIVRPSAVYGPHDRDFLALFRMAEWGVLLYPAVAEHWISLVFVEDLVNALLCAATNATAARRTYFITGETAVRWRDLGSAIAAAAGRSAMHVNVPRPMISLAAGAGDMLGRVIKTVPLANSNKTALARHPYWVCSGERARRELAIEEPRSLPDGIHETYYWYRRSGWLRGSAGVADRGA